MSEWLIGMFGEGGAQAIQVILALVFIIGLILIAAWLFQRLTGVAPQSREQGKHQRISVMEARAVDGRRKLVLLRRDNIEHLVLLGGPNDLVVEHHIVRHAPPRVARTGAIRQAAPTAEAPASKPAVADAPAADPPAPPPAADPEVKIPAAAIAAAAVAAVSQDAPAASPEPAPLPLESELDLGTFANQAEPDAPPEAANEPAAPETRSTAAAEPGENEAIDFPLRAQPKEVPATEASPSPTISLVEPTELAPAETTAAPEPGVAIVDPTEATPVASTSIDPPAADPISDAAAESVPEVAAVAAPATDGPKDWLTEFAGELLPESETATGSEPAADDPVPSINLGDVIATAPKEPSTPQRVEPTFDKAPDPAAAPEPPAATETAPEDGAKIVPNTNNDGPSVTESRTVSDDPDEDLIPVIDFTAEKKAHLSARKAQGEDELESEMARLIGELADPKS